MTFNCKLYVIYVRLNVTIQFTRGIEKKIVLASNPPGLLYFFKNITKLSSSEFTALYIKYCLRSANFYCNNDVYFKTTLVFELFSFIDG